MVGNTRVNSQMRCNSLNCALVRATHASYDYGMLSIARAQTKLKFIHERKVK